jgi:hypothetical protein
MIVIKSIAQYAATVRSVAGEQPSYRTDIRSDLNEAARILERVAHSEANPPMIVREELNILEEEA